ncbi:MAG: LPXTG cell wall anchor domain-containing protein, partial [Clostridiales bacterium]|nr:LPXTG cell wall anchor domain-containing protein [Clostridiales bacterium]
TSITSSGGGSYVTYGNTVDFFGLEVKGNITVGEGGIDKTGVYNAGDSWEDTTIDWTIEAFIPSGKVYNWYISDTEDVVIGSSSQQYYYNALGDTTTIITAEIDGKVYTVPNIDDAANDGSDLIAWALSGTSTEDGYDYGRTICFYTWDSSSGTWSQWWNIDSGTYLTITYSSSVVYDDENLIEEYNTQGASLQNSVQLQNNGTDGRSENKVAEATAEVPLPSFLDKEQTTAPTSDNEWVVTYTVTFNAAMVDLSGLGTVTIADTMSSTLAFIRDSISITAKDAKGNTHKVTDYTIEYTSGTDNNVAKIILNESALGPYQYTLVYNAQVTGSGTVSYSNAIEVTVFGETFTDEVGTLQVDYVSADAQTYSVTLTKTDATTSDKLAGAVFNVYNAETDSLLTTVTTGTDGTATVRTNTAEGIVFKAHTLYYFIETKAPDGYVLDNTTKYYFWFCDVDGTCSTCDSMTDELKANEGNDVKLYKGVYDSSLTVENIAIEVTNEQGVELPKTGGPGTYWYTTAGTLLTGGGAYLLYKTLRRRKGGKRALPSN